MHYNKALDFFKNLFKEYVKDKVTTLSAALAYYTLFSIAPILFLAISSIGILLGEDAVRAQIIAQISAVMGANTAELVRGNIEALSKPVDGLLANSTSIILLLIGASGIFSEIQSGLNEIWGVKPNPNRTWLNTLMDRFLSFTMVLIIGFLFLIFMVLSLVLSAMSGYLALIFGEINIMIGKILNSCISFLVTTALFAALFKVLPDVYMQWRDVWLGAFITAILYSLGKYGLGLYLSHSHIVSFFGASGSIIILLIWIYYSAQIFFIGAEITKIFAIKSGKRVIPTKKINYL